MLNTLRQVLRLTKEKKPRKREGKVYKIPIEKVLEIKRLQDAFNNKRGSSLAEHFRLWIAIFRAMPDLPLGNYILRHPCALTAEVVEIITEEA